jgi:predicted nucleic acid-binding protein
LNLVDSSGWLEYLADGPNADFFEEPLSAPNQLLVPTLCLYEVFRVVLRERGENDAILAAALMEQGRSVEFSGAIALFAARLSLDFKIPMADSIVAATGSLLEAVIWTQDEDFKNLKNVKCVQKKKPGRG